MRTGEPDDEAVILMLPSVASGVIVPEGLVVVILKACLGSSVNEMVDFVHQRLLAPRTSLSGSRSS